MPGQVKKKKDRVFLTAMVEDSGEATRDGCPISLKRTTLLNLQLLSHTDHLSSGLKWAILAHLRVD